MKRDVIEDILTTLVIIAFLIVIFMLLWKIFGDSPTVLDLLITLVGGLLLYILKTEYTRGKFEGQFKSFIYCTKEGFNKVKEDINNFRSDMKENLSSIKIEIKSDISKLRREIKSKKKINL